MTLQLLLTGIIIAAAFVYGGVALMRKTRSFSQKKKCGDDCGCDR